MFRFDGRIAVITGAGGGLGKAYALLLASRGAAVVVNDPGGDSDGKGGDPERAARVAAAITATGGEVLANYESVSNPEGAERLIAAAVDRFGRVDILIIFKGLLDPLT